MSDFVQLGNMASVAVARLVLRSRDVARVALQAQLAQRQRLESLGLLAGGVAHDFNNLLTVIRASVGFIGEGPLTAAQRDDLALIADAEQSATHLTKKLLMLGHQEPPAFESADLNKVVREFLRLLERVIPASIERDFVEGAALPKLRIDPRQLEQVLMNLALNARDAMPNGGRLTIETQQVVVNGEYRRAHPWAKPGRYVLLTVSDTGVGMPPEVVDARVRAVLHHQAQGRGDGAGAVGDLGDRAAARRHGELLLGGGRRHDVQDLSAGGGGSGRRRGQPDRRRCPGRQRAHPDRR